MNLKNVELSFKAELEKIRKLPAVKEIRVKGMLAAIDLHKSIDPKKFFNQGLYLVVQTNRIILAPPLIIDDSLLKEAMTKISIILGDS